MSLIPDRPDLTPESECGRTPDGKYEAHKFRTHGGDVAPAGTICTCGKVRVVQPGIPPTVERIDAS